MCPGQFEFWKGGSGNGGFNDRVFVDVILTITVEGSVCRALMAPCNDEMVIEGN